MINFLKPHTWSRYYNEGVQGVQVSNRVTYKPHLLLSQLAIISILVAFFHLVMDIVAGSAVPVFMDMVMIIVLAMCYFANEKGYKNLARAIIILVVNFVIFFYANIIPKENGLYFLYFPLLSVYFLIFDYKDHLKRFILFIVSISLFVLLEITDYKVFGIYGLVDKPTFASYLLNFISAISILFFAFNFIINANFRAEQELRRKSERIMKQNHDLEKTNRELDLFVYRSSHDIKAPLASVQGLLYLLQREDLNPVQQEYTLMIKDRVQKLESFIAEITKYSRNVRVAVEPEEVDLDELLEEIIEGHRFYKSSEKINVTVKNDVSGPVLIDKSRFVTILNNLYSNAVKYHNLNQLHPKIIISCWVADNFLHFEIADNGPGIDPEIQPKIFDMFYRGNEASDGSGLGLFIVKEVIEKLEGSISLAANNPTGTIFKFQLPLLTTEPAQ